MEVCEPSCIVPAIRSIQESIVVRRQISVVLPEILKVLSVIVVMISLNLMVLLVSIV